MVQEKENFNNLENKPKILAEAIKNSFIGLLFISLFNTIIVLVLSIYFGIEFSKKSSVFSAYHIAIVIVCLVVFMIIWTIILIFSFLKWKVLKTNKEQIDEMTHEEFCEFLISKKLFLKFKNKDNYFIFYKKWSKISKRQGLLKNK